MPRRHLARDPYDLELDRFQRREDKADERAARLEALVSDCLSEMEHDDTELREAIVATQENDGETFAALVRDAAVHHQPLADWLSGAMARYANAKAEKEMEDNP